MDKAPGPDGFTMGFFIMCREVLKHDIMGVFYNFHSHGLFEKNFNAAYIALIPKEWCKGIEGLEAYKPNREQLQDYCKSPD